MEAVMSFPRLGFEIIKTPGIKLRTSLIALLLCFVMMWTACSPAWINTALTDLAVLIPMAQSIASLIALTQGNTPPSPQEIYAINQIGKVASDGLKAIQALYNSYTAANATTVIAEIQAGGAALIVNLQQLLAAAQIKNPNLLARVTAAVGIIVNTLNAFLTLLPQAQAKMARRAARALAAKLPTPADLRQQWSQQVGVPVVAAR